MFVSLAKDFMLLKRDYVRRYGPIVGIADEPPRIQERPGLVADRFALDFLQDLGLEVEEMELVQINDLLLAN